MLKKNLIQYTNNYSNTHSKPNRICIYARFQRAVPEFPEGADVTRAAVSACNSAAPRPSVSEKRRRKRQSARRRLAWVTGGWKDTLGGHGGHLAPFDVAKTETVSVFRGIFPWIVCGRRVCGEIFAEKSIRRCCLLGKITLATLFSVRFCRVVCLFCFVGFCLVSFD